MHGHGHMVFFDPTNRRKGAFRVLVVTGLIAALMCSLAIITALFTVPTKTNAVSEKEALIAYQYYQLPIHRKQLALTFDDGPHPVYTDRVLTILKEEQVHATFFMIGGNVAKYPDMAKRVQEEGHTIGNHTYTHQQSVHSAHTRLALELRMTDIVLKDVLNESPRIYRPPYLLDIGSDPSPNPEYPLTGAEVWALSEGYFPIGADIDPKDWLSDDPKVIEERFFTELEKGGKIILLHDGPADHRFATIDALQPIIRDAKAAGYEFVPVTDLFAPKGPLVFATNLGLGDTGDSVYLLQWFLFARGYTDQYAITGTYGVDTETAMRAFQLRHTLPVTGLLDARSRTAIAKVEIDVPSFAQGKKPTAGERIAAEVFSYPRLLVGFAGLALVFALFRIMFFAAVLSRSTTRKRREGTYSGGVTVLIPAYNESANVAATIKSVQASDFDGPMEVIVIDDGSSDETAAFAREASKGGTVPITLVRKQNGGKARALNFGFAAAKYDVVVALDGDVILEPRAISALMRPFGDPRVAAVAGKVYTTSRHDFLDRFQRIEYITGQNIEKKAYGALGAVSVVPGAIGAWRKDLVRAAGGYKKDTLAEDMDLTLTLLGAGFRIEYAPHAVAYTETPFTIRDFFKQRFRWVYGSIQCFWKHKSAMLRAQGTPLGSVILPMMLIYGMFLPLLYPVFDIALIMSLWGGTINVFLITMGLYTLVDMLYVAIALMGEKKQRIGLLFLVPFQRLFYRPVIWFVVLKSIVRAIEGTFGNVSLAAWNRVMKQGDAARLYGDSGFTALPKN